MPQIPRRLSEQDMAQLYLHTEAPLRLDDLLQDQGLTGDAGQIAVHDSISDQTPDMALISLSLCGLIIARDYPVALRDAYMGPVLRELEVAAQDNLVTLGRLWLDSTLYGVTPDKKADRATIESTPDRLRVLTSIFFELRAALDEAGDECPIMKRALGTLYYQAESHADLADRFVARFVQAIKRERGRARRPVPDQIPLPFDLDRPRQGAEIVSFSQFRPKQNA